MDLKSVIFHKSNPISKMSDAAAPEGKKKKEKKVKVKKPAGLTKVNDITL